MKKIWIVLFALTCILGLTACDPGTNRVDSEEILSNIEKIELFNYENTSPKLLRIKGKRKPIFDFSKATLIATLDDSHFEDVLEDISQQELLIYGNTLNEPIGKTLVIYQNDGNMMVLFGCVYQQERGGKKYYGECNIYDENGLFVEHIGRIASDYVDTLEIKYFEKTNN